MRHCFATLSLILLALLAAPSPVAALSGAYLALEQDVLTLPEQTPQLVYAPDSEIRQATITLTGADGWTKTFTTGATSPGQERRFTWDVDEGDFEYDVEVQTRYADGSRNTMQLALFLTAATPLEVDLPPSAVDLDARTFTLSSNRPLRRVELTLTSDTMEQSGPHRVDVTPHPEDPRRATVQWPELEANLLRLRIRAFDTYAFWSDVDVTPWNLTIPHEDVVFATASHEVETGETAKLDTAMARIQRAVRRYGSLVDIHLFVGGYTDTVGDRASNAALSMRRAKAIAEYFRAAGLSFPIHYQGFGESVLAVPTADSVDEAQNRRATYTLTAGNPPTGSDTPTTNWQRLR